MGQSGLDFLDYGNKNGIRILKTVADLWVPAKIIVGSAGNSAFRARQAESA
jgi:hypothetical protein